MLKEKTCSICGAGNLWAYLYRRSDTICLPCHIADIEAKRYLIESVPDVAPVPPPLGYLSATEKFLLESEDNWDKGAYEYGWDN